MKDKQKRVLVLDGDIISYVCAAAAEKRTILVTHSPSKIQKSFKTRTEFKKMMEEKNKPITEDYLIQDVQEAESPAFCMKVIRQKIEKLKKKTEADEVFIFAGEENNFRVNLPLPNPYKGNREDMLRPILLDQAKEYIRNVHKAVKSYSHETDDSVTIKAYDELAKGNLAIIGTIDKDAYQSVGIHVLNFDDPDFNPELIDELGSLYVKKPAVKGSGLKFLCFQWIWGDTSDGYCGYDLANIRFGAMSAYKLLNDKETVKDCLQVVIDTFQKWYPEEFEYTDFRGNTIKADWKFMLEMYYACAKMKTHAEDKLNPKELFEKYGIEYENSKYRSQIVI